MPLMSEDTSNRWAIVSLDVPKFTVTVAASQLNREEAYHVPYLTHAIIKNENLMVATSFNKIMEIDLSDGSRRFVD